MGLILPAKTIRLHEFQRTVREYDCSISKTSKEWEVVDNTDGKWVCGFATISGREVKVSYVRNFEKLITQKRQEQKSAKNLARRKGIE